MICSEAQKLIPDLLLGELSTEDESTVRAHLAAGCSECSAIMEETEATLGILLDVVPPESPSPEMFDRLSARIEVEPTASARSVASVLRDHDWVITAVASVAAAIIAMLGSWTLFSATHSNEGEELRRLQVAVAKRKDEIGALSRELQDVGGFTEALRSPDLYVLNFKSLDDANPDASSRALWDAAGRRLCIAFTKLPQPINGEVLSIWGNSPNPQRLADFKVTAQGDAALVLNVAGDIRPDAFVVSMESLDAIEPQQPILIAEIAQGTRLAAVGSVTRLASR